MPCNDFAGNLVIVSAHRRVDSRRNIETTYGLKPAGLYYYSSRDGGTLYGWGTGRDGRECVWAVPVAGGTPRLVIAYDDPALTARSLLAVSGHRLYLDVSEDESHIWVAILHW